MNYTRLKYELRGQVAIVALNDPATLNAVSEAMGEELLQAVDHAQLRARALVIMTTSRAFCSGANLATGRFDLSDPQRDAGAGLETLFNPLLLRLRDSRIPVLTAVRGAAAGIGASIALFADVIVAAESAYFYMAFSRVGLVPDGGAAYLLSRSVGRVRAMEMMLLGEKLPARKAFEWGLVTRVVPDEELDATALQLATQLAQGPRSLGMIRQAAWEALDLDLQEQLTRERCLQCSAGRTADFVEGVSAFREKRAAVFKGK
jgi:2-(1,2-epoxy-1,2-dihydrophenyl)acetyl-CoA isomerase